jgi:hypothetical protein
LIAVSSDSNPKHKKSPDSLIFLQGLFLNRRSGVFGFSERTIKHSLCQIQKRHFSSALRALYSLGVEIRQHWRCLKEPRFKKTTLPDSDQNDPAHKKCPPENSNGHLIFKEISYSTFDQPSSLLPSAISLSLASQPSGALKLHDFSPQFVSTSVKPRPSKAVLTALAQPPQVMPGTLSDTGLNSPAGAAAELESVAAGAGFDDSGFLAVSASGAQPTATISKAAVIIVRSVRIWISPKQRLKRLGGGIFAVN